MRRAVAVLLLAIAGAGCPAMLAAQSSQFGVRGLGLPMRPLSPRALATGGAFAHFDVESSLNPASIASVLQFTSLLTAAQSFRRSTNRFGSASGRDARFPQVIAVGPIGGTRLAGAVSVSGYTDRSFSLATQDTVVLRDVPVPVFDTLRSTGGLTDLRVALGWVATGDLHLGVATHIIPGSNRLENRRVFADSNYAGALERADLSYLGFGFSGGFVWRATPRVVVAGLFRTDRDVKIDRDTTRVGSTDLPIALGASVHWQLSPGLSVATSYLRRHWSSADGDIKVQGGIGAMDSYDLAAGAELVGNPRNPGHRPLRLGLRYSTLPFPAVAGRQPRELGLSAGTGLRFTGGRGGIDLALEQLWRSDGAGATERATVITLGISIRP